jgi:hypothetical protein
MYHRDILKDVLLSVTDSIPFYLALLTAYSEIKSGKQCAIKTHPSNCST